MPLCVWSGKRGHAYVVLSIECVRIPSNGAASDGADLANHIAVLPLAAGDGEVAGDGQPAMPSNSAASARSERAAALSIALSSSPDAASVSDVQSLGQVLQQMVSIRSPAFHHNPRLIMNIIFI